jgi:hypothetical protein
MSELTKTERLEAMGYTPSPPPEAGIAARLKWEAEEIERQRGILSEYDRFYVMCFGSAGVLLDDDETMTETLVSQQIIFFEEAFNL